MCVCVCLVETARGDSQAVGALRRAHQHACARAKQGVVVVAAISVLNLQGVDGIHFETQAVCSSRKATDGTVTAPEPHTKAV